MKELQLKKVFYAEDEKDIQIIVKNIVELMGDFEIKIFNDGLELLNGLNEDETPDLILLDVMMPNMGGLDTLDNLKNNETYNKYKDIPVIFITAKSQINEIQNYLKLGISGIITKPFEPLTLCDTIKMYWINAISV